MDVLVLMIIVVCVGIYFSRRSQKSNNSNSDDSGATSIDEVGEAVVAGSIDSSIHFLKLNELIEHKESAQRGEIHIKIILEMVSFMLHIVSRTLLVQTSISQRSTYVDLIAEWTLLELIKKMGFNSEPSMNDFRELFYTRINQRESAFSEAKEVFAEDPYAQNGIINLATLDLLNVIFPKADGEMDLLKYQTQKY
mgnify:FL=1